MVDKMRWLAVAFLTLSASIAVGMSVPLAQPDEALVVRGPVHVAVGSDGQVLLVAIGAAAPGAAVSHLFAMHAAPGERFEIPGGNLGSAVVTLRSARLTVDAGAGPVVFRLPGRDRSALPSDSTSYRVVAIAHYPNPGPLAAVVDLHLLAENDPLAGTDQEEGGGDPCSGGGPGSGGCSISGCTGNPTGCTVSCEAGYYACCFCSTAAICRCVPNGTGSH